jgi:hypothetical protein
MQSDEVRPAPAAPTVAARAATCGRPPTARPRPPQVVWQLIAHGHCSFRAKTITQNFCRNEYNVTGAPPARRPAAAAASAPPPRL